MGVLRVVVAFIAAAALFLTFWHCPSIPDSQLSACQYTRPYVDQITSHIPPRIREHAGSHIAPLRDSYAKHAKPLEPAVQRATSFVLYDLPQAAKWWYIERLVPLELGARTRAAAERSAEMGIEAAKNSYKYGRKTAVEVWQIYISPLTLRVLAGVRELWATHGAEHWRDLREKFVDAPVSQILSAYSEVSTASLESSATWASTIDVSSVSTEGSTARSSSVPTSAVPVADNDEADETFTEYKTVVVSVVQSIPGASSPPSSLPSSASSSTPGEPVIHEKVDWAQRVNRTVESALENMKIDAEVALERSLADAKPDIMQLLRDISQHAIEAATELEEVRASVVDRDEEVDSKATYKLFEDHSRELADMALLVRDRAMELAESALNAVKPVKQVTLDALDDFFDVVLLEAARQVADAENSDWADWRAYHDLKGKLNDAREIVSNYEFDMETVNTALREAQSMSVILVQDTNRHLQELRAMIQLRLQERAMKEASEVAEENDFRVPDADYYEDLEEVEQFENEEDIRTVRSPAASSP